MNELQKKEYDQILEELNAIAMSINKLVETIKILCFKHDISDYLILPSGAADADREVEKLFHVLKPFYKIMEYGDLPPLSFSIFTEMALLYFKASLTGHEYRYFAAVDAISQKHLRHSFIIMGVKECIACDDEKSCLEYLGTRYLNEVLKLIDRPIQIVDAKRVDLETIVQDLEEPFPKPIWVFLRDYRYFDFLNERLINLKKAAFIRRKRTPVSRIDVVEGLTHYKLGIYIRAVLKFGVHRVISDKGKIGILLKDNNIKIINHEEDLPAMDPSQ